MTAPEIQVIAAKQVGDVTVELIDASTFAGFYTIYVTCDRGEIAVDERHAQTAQNRFDVIVRQLRAGKTFRWLRSLVLTFQPAPEEVTA